MPDPESTQWPGLKLLAFEAMQGWKAQDHRIALEAFQRSAREMLEAGSGFRREALLGGSRADWAEACTASLAASDARSFFEHHFWPYLVEDRIRPEGLFTGYFEPELRGSRKPHDAFRVPVYRKPDDLVALSETEEQQTGLRYGRRINGRPEPYPVRKEIEGGALHDRGLEICWTDSWVDTFFMHIQGNGRVRLDDGRTIRLSYAAKTGHPYTGVGGVLAERGILTRETMSMQTVKAWMAAHPQEARELMWLNKSFVFFREAEIEDNTLGAVGAAKVNLTPHHSMAVDRSIWMFGTPFWVETSYPLEARPQGEAIARLMIGQDTGSAIKGAVRGDFYWGWGDDAALVAGHMKSRGRMTVLLPKPVARHLGLPMP